MSECVCVCVCVCVAKQTELETDKGRETGDTNAEIGTETEGKAKRQQ